MKKEKSIINKLLGLSTMKKVIIIALYLLLSFVFIFYKSNSFNLKYKVTNETSVFNNYKKEVTDHGNVYTMELDNTYAKRIFVKYSSDKEFDMRLIYSIVENNNTTFEIDELNKCSYIIDQNVYSVKNRFNKLVVEVPNGVEIQDVVVNNKLTFDYSSLVICVIVLLIACSILYVYKDGKEKIYIIFFTIFVSFGTFFVLFSPVSVGMSWDDQIHFKNTIRTIHFGDYLASDVENEIMYLSTPFHEFDNIEEQGMVEDKFNEMDKNKIVEMENDNVIVQNSIAYIPGSVIYYTLNKAGVPFTIRFKFIKIVMIIIYALIICYAIKIIPKYKSLLFALGLIPSTVFVAANYSYDEWVIAFMLYGFALFVKMMDSDKVESKDVVKYIASVSIASLIKLMYSPALLLLILIPNKKFKSNKNAVLFKLLLMVVIFVVTIAFTIPTLFSHLGVDDSRGGENVSTIDQVKYILNNPVKTTKLFSTVMFQKFGANSLGLTNLLSYAYLGGDINFTIYLLMIIGIIIAYIHSCNDGNELSVKNRVAVILVYFIIQAFTYGILYLMFNNVGATDIGGVQPRYFTPILVLLIYASITKKIKFDISLFKAVTIISIIYTLVYIYSLYSSLFVYIY